MRGWWGNPWGFKSRLRHHKMPWEFGEFRCRDGAALTASGSHSSGGTPAVFPCTL